MHEPAVCQYSQGLIAERVDSWTTCEGVSDQNVQALDPLRHPAGRDTCDLRYALDALPRSQVAVMGILVLRSEPRVLAEPALHVAHETLGLERADSAGQPRTREVVKRRKRSAVGQPRRCHDDVGLAAGTPVRDGNDAPWITAELAMYRLTVGGRHLVGL
jgi:hypothetical protein